jgi:hypothetical protein
VTPSVELTVDGRHDAETVDTLFTVGDIVIINPYFARPTQRGVVYRVTRRLPINIIAEPVADRAIKANPGVLLPAPADAAAESTATGTTATAVGVPYQPRPPAAVPRAGRHDHRTPVEATRRRAIRRTT